MPTVLRLRPLVVVRDPSGQMRDAYLFTTDPQARPEWVNLRKARTRKCDESHQRLVRIPCRVPRPHTAGNLGLVVSSSWSYSIRAFGVDARFADGAESLLAPPAGSIGLGSVFGPRCW